MHHCIAHVGPSVQGKTTAGPIVSHHVGGSSDQPERIIDRASLRTEKLYDEHVLHDTYAVLYHKHSLPYHKHMV